MGFIETEQLVSAEESRNCSEGLHDDVAADDDCEYKLLEEPLDHPRIDRRSAHEELRRDTKLSQEEAEEFGTFDDVKLRVVPCLTLGIR